VARHSDGGFLTEDRVFRQHAVQVGAEPVGQVIGFDRSAEPARVEAADNPVSDREPCDAITDGCNLAGTIAKRYDPKLGRTASPPFSTIKSR
jgi:hypothetical protein